MGVVETSVNSAGSEVFKIEALEPYDHALKITAETIHIFMSVGGSEMGIRVFPEETDDIVTVLLYAKKLVEARRKP